jgi:hypothetical protein
MECTKLKINISNEVTNWCSIFYINISVLHLFSTLQRDNRALLHYKGKPVLHFYVHCTIYHPNSERFLTFTKTVISHKRTKSSICLCLQQFDTELLEQDSKRTYVYFRRKNSFQLSKDYKFTYIII